MALPNNTLSLQPFCCCLFLERVFDFRFLFLVSISGSYCWNFLQMATATATVTTTAIATAMATATTKVTATVKTFSVLLHMNSLVSGDHIAERQCSGNAFTISTLLTIIPSLSFLHLPV